MSYKEAEPNLPLFKKNRTLIISPLSKEILQTKDSPDSFNNTQFKIFHSVD